LDKIISQSRINSILLPFLTLCAQIHHQLLLGLFAQLPHLALRVPVQTVQVLLVQATKVASEQRCIVALVLFLKLS